MFFYWSSHGFLWRCDGVQGAVGVNHDLAVRPRRQDREPENLEIGAIYAMRVGGFRAARHHFFGKVAIHEVAPAFALEIDTLEDLQQARLSTPMLEPQIVAAAVPNPLRGVVFDFDGVMTDEKVTVDQDGREAVVCNPSDGHGIAVLKANNIRVAVISLEENPVVQQRCAKLGITCVSASDDKLRALQALCREWQTSPDGIVFVGNDLPDIACMEAAGLGVAVADASPIVRAAADLTLTRNGGQGAVRELCDLVVQALEARN